VLTAYFEPQTRIDVLLETGAYNCVSSAVLYLLLAKSANLEVRGVKTTDHAFCLVKTTEKAYDVETTNAFGFDPGTKKEFQDQFGRTTGYTYVPAVSDPGRKETEELGLLALILQNRAVLLSDRRQFEPAVGLTVDAYVLVKDEESYSNMIMAIMNLGALFNQKKDFQKGLAFVDRAVVLYGEEPRLAKLEGDLFHNWIVVLLSEKKDILGATQLVERRYEAGELSTQRWRSYMVDIYQLRSQDIAREQGFLNALSFIKKGLDRLGSDSRLENLQRIYLHNFEADAHNRMAAAYNAGQYEEAQEIIEEALEAVPGSERLKEDLKTVEQARDSD
jgi:tetratricopeptide (TPR) repeat protein